MTITIVIITIMTYHHDGGRNKYQQTKSQMIIWYTKIHLVQVIIFIIVIIVFATSFIIW